MQQKKAMAYKTRGESDATKRKQRLIKLEVSQMQQKKVEAYKTRVESNATKESCSL